MKINSKSWRLEKRQFLMYIESTFKYTKNLSNIKELSLEVWRDYNSRIRCSYGNGYRAGFIAGIKEASKK